MSIGKELKRLRQARGLTQEQVAARLNVTRQTVSSYESDRTRPDLEALTALCALYGTDLMALLYGPDPRDHRRIRVAAWVLLAVLFVLSLAGPILLWAADRFFPLLAPGERSAQFSVDDGTALYLQTHLRLTDAWAGVDGALLLTAGVGAALLVVLLLTARSPMPPRSIGRWLGLALGALLVPPLPFALTDPLHGPIDYCVPHVHAAAYLAVGAAVYALARLLRRRGQDGPS